MFPQVIKWLTALMVLVFVFLPAPASAGEVNLYFFWGDGCPHCAAEKPFLEQLKTKYSEVNIFSYEIWHSQGNARLLTRVANELQFQVTGVPLTIIGSQSITGFSSGITADQIENLVRYCISSGCPDKVASLINPVVPDAESVVGPTASPSAAPVENLIADSPEPASKITVPVFGEINLKSLSLPAVTIILGALDGFNPCAMWTLLFLISLLLGMQNKSRRWILGTVFIVASALVYFLFMAAWLNLLLFIGFIFWVRAGIGALAIFGAFYNLREFVVNPDGGCKVTGDEKRQAVFTKLKIITQQSHLLFALAGIIILAFAVNLVELFCSAGLPVIFTQILTLNNLSGIQYYAYMLLYILFFMLDDLFIFFTAMLTLELTGISTKYSRYSHLLGGFLMLIIGLLMLFRPEWLMFA